MDRNELCFEILFQYYQEFRAKMYYNGDSAAERIDNMDVDYTEKDNAQMWLIDSGYVDGRIRFFTNPSIPYPAIDRINSHGVDFVESVIRYALSKTKTGREFSRLLKPVGIKEFDSGCLRDYVKGRMWKTTYKAIINYSAIKFAEMDNVDNPSLQSPLVILSVQSDGGSDYRLYVSKQDVKRFDRSWEEIWIKLGEQPSYVTVRLTGSFWRSCHELRGREISEWIKQEGLDKYEKGHPNKLSLKHTEDRRFEVYPLP